MNPNLQLEVNDFWNKKVRFYFDTILDYDSDGFLSQNDIEIFKANYKLSKNLSNDSTELRRFSKFLNKWFNSITDFSNNHTGLISFADFYDYCKYIRTLLLENNEWPADLEYMIDYIQALFNFLDADGDGWISEHDYVSSESNFDNKEVCWKILTSNIEKKAIDIRCFEALCFEFVSSTNMNDNGNWIFGSF
jgi:hypothetical protein